jgi:hypothetical protein
MDIKVGQVWMLKSAEECENISSAFVPSEMPPFCGKEQTIQIIGGDKDKVYIHGCPYYWDMGCLDHLVRDVTDTTITPEPCPERVEIPSDAAFAKKSVANVGEQWLLKTWEELSEAARLQMVDTMVPYLGKVQRITGLADDYFEIEDGHDPDNRYRFPYECLEDYRPSSPPPEKGTVDTMSEALDGLHKVVESIRPVESSYDVLYETADGAGCVTVKLFINHRKHTYRVASLAKDGKFLFDTAQQGDPKIWRAVLKAIEIAMGFAEREVGHG